MEAYLSKVITTQKRFEIEYKLVLFAKSKSHMGFRSVPKSVTLSDLASLNDRLYPREFTQYRGNAAAVGANCVKLTEDRYRQRQKCNPGRLVLAVYGLDGVRCGLSLW